MTMMHSGKVLVLAGLTLTAMTKALEAQRFADYEVFPLEQWTVAVDVGDLDQDGDDDIALASDFCSDTRPCDLVIFYQAESGELSEPAFYPSLEATSVVVADLDADGLEDVALAVNTGVYFYPQQPDGSLKPSEEPISQSSSFKIAAGDFNRDGLQELVSLPFGFSTDDLYLVLRDEAGGFLEERYVLEHHGFDDLKVADVDGDGYLDVLTVSSQGALEDNIGVLHGDSMTRFRPERRIDSGWPTGFDGIAAADFDADGDTDLAVLSSGVAPDYTPFVGILHQDEGGEFSAASRLPLPFLGGSILAADLDRNGLTDIAVETGRQLRIWYQDCGGFLSLSESYALPPGNYSNPHQMAAGDFNSDGIVDISVASDNYGLVVFYGVVREVAFDCSAGCASGADTDGDGTPDICDLCEGFDDAEDADSDGVPDGCDLCLGENFTGDSDDDGVCNDRDICLGDDLFGDLDGDGQCGDVDPCTETPTNLCLRDDRFELRLSWRDFQGRSGSGRSVHRRTEDSVLLWFFREENWEMLVKILDGCNINDHFWVFAATTTNVEFVLTVKDTATGEERIYANPLGVNAAALTDTKAFATCQKTSARSARSFALRPPLRPSPIGSKVLSERMDDWIRAGPTDGLVIALAASGPGTTTSYAATRVPGADQGFLFVSRDGWESWSPLASPTGTSVGLQPQDIAAAPQDPDILYLATFGQGVLSSTDGGMSWTPKNTGLPSLLTRQILMDANDPEILYTTVSGSGVFKSSDGGDSWRDISPVVGAGNTGRLVLHPRSSGTMFLPTINGLMKSLDGGTVWLRAGIDLPASNISALAVDPGAAETLYAARFGQIFKTTDALHWEIIGAVSSDGDVCCLAVDPSDRSVLLAAVRGFETEKGVVRSLDGGRTWEFVDLVGESVIELIHDERSPGTWLAGTQSRLFKSVDGGDSWRPAIRGMASSAIHSLAVSPSRPGTIYAAAETLPGRLYRSSDAALTWSTTSPSPTTSEVRALAVHPSDPEVIFAGGGAGIGKSIDGGRSWQHLPFRSDVVGPAVTEIVIDPLNPDRLFAVAGQILGSRDGGASWSVLLAPLDSLSLALDPGNADVLYAGTRSGVLKSVDRGQTWNSAGSGLGDGWTERLAAVWQEPGTLYALSGSPPRVFKTSDGAASWSLSDTGIPAGTLTDLVVDPAESGTVYVSHEGGWIYWSQDGGKTWQSLEPAVFDASSSEPGREPRPIRRLAIDTDRRLYAATFGRGVPRLTLGDAPEIICAPDATRFCLNRERFLVEVQWRDFTGRTGAGQTVFGSEDSGVFWFFDSENWEMLVKVLDGCTFNDRFWVFSAATTNVEYRLKVTDLVTGEARIYDNPLGNPAVSIIDTGAFATCDDGATGFLLRQGAGHGSDPSESE